MNNVVYDTDENVAIITINRPEVRNAVDRPTADALEEAFTRFETADDQAVAVLTGMGEYFCAGADLKGVSEGRGNRVTKTGPGPMGPTRMLLSKPVIAAVEGPAVAGGLELAVWCDLRVAARGAVFGVYCRRWGVPLVDGGTIRLPRLIGHSRALDMIITGRGVKAPEAYEMGLCNRLTDDGKALEEAMTLAKDIARLPPKCMNSDRLSSYEQWPLDLNAALRNETERGLDVIASGETAAGAARFASGKGRHGRRDDID